MGTKENPGKFDCYDKAMSDEPMFVVLGRDPYGPLFVEAWARERLSQIRDGKRPVTDIDQAIEAIDLAHQMAEWRHLNEGAWHNVAAKKKSDDE